MALELASGYVSINPSARGFGSKLNKEIGPDLDRAGADGGRRASNAFASPFIAGIKRAVGAAAVFLGFREIVGQIGGAISAASDFGETVAKTGQIFGREALPSLEAWSETAATAFGQSQTQALDAASTFGVFGKSAGLTGGDLTGFSTELVGLTADMASFANTTPEDAIEAVGAALRGESEPIRRYGVLLDDATLRNRALALGLISTTKDALTPQQRVLAAHAEILAQTGDIQGDFARTSDGLANQQRILNALWQDGKTQLGQALLPAATAVVSYLATTGVPGFLGFAEAVGDAFAAARDSEGVVAALDSVRSIGAAAFDALRDAVLGARDVVLEVFEFVAANQDAFSVVGAGVAGAAGSFFLLSRALQAVAAAQAAVAAVRAAGGIFASLGAAFPLLLNPIGLVIVAIVALGAAAFVAYKKFEPFRNVVDAIGRVIRDVAIAAFERLQAVVAVVAPAIASGFTTAVAGLQAAFGAVSAAVAAVVAAFSSVSSTVIAALTPLAGWIGEHLIPTIAAIAEAVGAFVAAVIDWITPFVEAWIAILGPILAVTADLFSDVFDVVSTILGLVFDVAGAQLGNLVDAFKSFAGVVEPLVKATWDTIKSIVETTLAVVKAVVESVLGSIRGVFQSITGLINGDWSKFWQGINTIVSSTFGAAVTIVSSILGTIRDAVTNQLSGLGGVARNAVGNLSGVLYDAGQDIIRGLVNGIKSMAGAAASAARNAVGGAIDAAKGILQIDSPSKVFFEIGEWSGEGLALGLERSARMVELGAEGLSMAAARSVAGGVASTPAPNVTPDGGIHIHLEGAMFLDDEIPGKLARQIERALVRQRAAIR